MCTADTSLRDLEEVLIRTAGDYDILGAPDRTVLSGAWVGGQNEKLAGDRASGSRAG